MKHANHLFFLNDEYSCRCNRSCSRRVNGLIRKAPYTEKVTWSQNLHDGFLATLTDYSKLYGTRSKVHHMLSRFALREDLFLRSKPGNRSSQTDRIKK